MPQPDDTVQDDPIDVSGATSAPSLDQVHALNQAHVEAEDEEEAEAAGDDDAGDDAGDDDAGDAGDDDAAGDDADDVVVDDDDADAGAGGDDDDEPAAPVTPPAPEATDVDLNVDITKNAAGKVAIKDADGNTFYFNNLDEVPDDFEPASYKALMVGTKALLKKEDDDAAAIANTQREAEASEARKQSEELQTSWENDATAMATAGVLPKEPAKLEAAKNKVYDYIESEMLKFQKSGGKDGAIHTNFRAAYKAMAFDEQQAANAKKQKDIDAAKKKRGSVVQPGSGTDAGGSSSTRGNRVIEAPPSGVGLDAVHNHAVSQL